MRINAIKHNFVNKIQTKPQIQKTNYKTLFYNRQYKL